MKIKNRQIVDFFNNAQGILSKEIPFKLYTAISLNLKGLGNQAEVYSNLMTKIRDNYTKKDENGAVVTDKNGNPLLTDAAGFETEMQSLLEVESEAVIQTVPDGLLDKMDSDPKFGALSGKQYAALEFMIGKQ